MDSGTQHDFAIPKLKKFPFQPSRSNWHTFAAGKENTGEALGHCPNSYSNRWGANIFFYNLSFRESQRIEGNAAARVL